MYVSIAVVRALLDTLQRAGVSSDSFAIDAGLEPEDFSDPATRIPASRLRDIVRAALEASDDPALALHVGESSAYKALHLVGLVVANAGSLREGISLHAQFAPLVLETARFELVERNGEARIVYERADVTDDFARFDAELALSLLSATCGALLAAGQRPRRVSFRSPRPSYSAEHVRVFGCPVSFGAQANELVFDAALLDLPHLHRDEALCELLKQRAEVLLARRNSEERLLERVRDFLRYEPDLGTIDLERLARRLGIGTRTLQRRLYEHSASLSQLLDEARREKACEALKIPEIDVKELAHRLGFSERSAFQRAFKRWTGQTPIQFRAEATQTTPKANARRRSSPPAAPPPS